MAKIIKYKFLCCEVNHGTEENPDIEQILLKKEIRCPNEAVLEVNLPIAQKEAYNGEYTIEDDGVEEIAEPTQEERIAELEEALALLLSGVTE